MQRKVLFLGPMLSVVGCLPTPEAIVGADVLTAKIVLPAGDQLKVGETVGVPISITGGTPPYHGILVGGEDRYHFFGYGLGGRFGYEHQNDFGLEITDGFSDYQGPLYFTIQFKTPGPAQIELKVNDSNSMVATDQVTVMVSP